MPVLQLGLDISNLQRGAGQASDALEEVTSAAADAQKNAEQMTNAFADAAKSILAVVAGFKALDSLKSFAQRGVQFNSSMEQSRIGIASILTAMTNLQDEQGRVLEGAEKYAAAQSLSLDIMSQIQKLGLETTATTEELVQGFQSLMGAALNAGLKLEQIPRFAVAGAQAMQTLGIPLNQMRTELDALLTGSINKSQDLLAPRLGLDKETIQSWREQGILFDELMKKLSAFETAGADVAQTWQGLVSNFSEAMDVIAGDSAGSLSQSLKESLVLLQDLMITTGNGAPKISADFEQIANVLQGLEAALGEVILTLTKNFTEAVKGVNSAISELGGSEALFGRIETSVATVGAALASVAVLRKTGAADAITAAQKQTAAMVAEKEASLASAQAMRNEAAAAVESAAQRSVATEAAVKEAQVRLQTAQARTQEAKGSTALTAALVREEEARQVLLAAEANARNSAATLATAKTALAQAESKVAQATQQAAAATTVQARTVSTAQGVWTAACIAMTGAATRLGTAIKALWAGLGGGVGVAITALTTAIAYFSTRQDDAARAADLHSTAQTKLNSITQELKKSTGELNTVLTATQKIKIADAQNEAMRAYELQINTIKSKLQELIEYERMANETVAQYGGTSVISDDVIAKVQEFYDILSKGPEHAQEAQEALSNLRLEMREAGLGSTGLAQNLDELAGMTDASGRSWVDYAATVQQAQGMLASMAGTITAAANAAQQGIKGLDEAIKKSEFAKYTSALSGGDKSAANVLQGLGVESEQIKKALAGDYSGFSEGDRSGIQKLVANYRDISKVKISSSGGGGGGSIGGGTSAIESARKSVEALRKEISVLRGETTKTSGELAKKFESIASAGKAAGMTVNEINALQQEYKQAFQADTLKDFNTELLRVQGNTKALKEIEVAEKVKEWTEKFNEAGISAEEAQTKIATMKAALENQTSLQDLQSAIGFYKELAELSGNFGLSLEYQNRLILAQGDAYRQSGISEELVKQWEILQQLQNARDPFSGIARANSQYFTEATDYASKMEQIWTTSMDGMADALTTFCMSGKLDFQDLANSFIQMIIKMQMQAAISGLFKGITSFVGDFFGGSSSGGGTAAANGGVFSGGISALSGGIYNKPTFFSFGVQKFAKGGVLGEAGPEAVMPLTRTDNGKLGVRAVGGGVSVPINIEVYNQTGNDTEVETQKRQNSEGGTDIRMIIKRIVVEDITSGNGGIIDGALRGTYQNLKRQQRGR